jgi:hypothetical protein
MRKKRNAYKLLPTGGKTRRKRSLGRPRRMWVDNERIDLGDTKLYEMDWTDLA